MSRRFSLDSYMQGGGAPVGGRTGRRSRRSSEDRRTKSLEETQADMRELGQSISNSLSRTPEAIEEEGFERPDGVISKSRFLKYNKTFHKLFQDVPEVENLTHAFTCALQKEVLYHGKLFVSENHVCFYSSVLLKDTKVQVHVSDVCEVKKLNSALSVLSIRTAGGDKYSFVSLRNREVCYRLLQSLCPRIQVESTNSSPRVSSPENGPEPDADTMSSPSSQEDSVRHRQARQDRDFSDLGARNRGSSTPLSSASRDLNEPFTDEENKVSSCSQSMQMKCFFLRQISDLNVFMTFYLLLLLLLLLSSGYIGLRIIALEEQLSSLSALPDFYPTEAQSAVPPPHHQDATS